MLIEIFPNKDWVIWSFRHWRNPRCLNKPNTNNVYKINRSDFKDLVIALDHTAVLWTKEKYDFNTGNLYLKIIDNAWYYYKKWKFLENVLNPN